MAEPSPWILDEPPADVQAEIIERSAQLPIVIDFWAPWCQPCKTLGPVLEKAAREGDGRFLLVKVNIDEHQQLAAAFRVSSIPAVFALRDGQLVNQFVGMLDESQLTQWLNGIMPSAVDELIRRGRELEATDPLAAEQTYRDALDLEPDNDAVRVRMACVLAAQERDDEASRIISDLEKRGFLEPEAEQVRSQLELRAAAAEAGDVTEVRAKVAANPDDSALQIQLADTLAVHKQYREAMEICLELVRKDRDGLGDEARQTMIKIFDLVGPQSELVSEYRRKLATALY